MDILKANTREVTVDRVRRVIKSHIEWKTSAKIFKTMDIVKEIDDHHEMLMSIMGQLGVPSAVDYAKRRMPSGE